MTQTSKKNKLFDVVCILMVARKRNIAMQSRATHPTKYQSKSIIISLSIAKYTFALNLRLLLEAHVHIHSRIRRNFEKILRKFMMISKRRSLSKIVDKIFSDFWWPLKSKKKFNLIKHKIF